MKKIILFLITVFISISAVFADTSVGISVDKNTINAGDIFNVAIKISTDKEANIEIVEIQGLDTFNITSQKQTSQVQIINGKTNSVQGLDIGLVSSQTGTYLLGPVKIKIADEEFFSNQIELTINDFTVPTLDQNKTRDNTKNPENNNTETNENTKPEEINDTISENIIEDIHPVKKLDINFNVFKYKGIIYFGFFIIFIAMFYLFLIKILENKKISEKNKQIETDKKLQKQVEIKNIYEELLELSKRPEDFSQENFYTRLNVLFRRYFLYIGVELADKKTLSELKNDTIDNKILDIFSKSYMYEFSTQTDTLSERKQIIMNFMIFLKK